MSNDPVTKTTPVLEARVVNCVLAANGNVDPALVLKLAQSHEKLRQELETYAARWIVIARKLSITDSAEPDGGRYIINLPADLMSSRTPAIELREAIDKEIRSGRF